VLALTYKEIGINEFEELEEDNNNFKSELDRNVLDQEMTLLALIAINNELRPKIVKSIKLAE